jgi:hypothetical protein
VFIAIYKLGLFENIVMRIMFEIKTRGNHRKRMHNVGFHNLYRLSDTKSIQEQW